MKDYFEEYSSKKNFLPQFGWRFRGIL